MTVNDTTLLIFKAIASFIHDMNEIYGSEYKPLLLYSTLLEKTGVIHDEPIRKHIQVFQSFVVQNENAITSKDESLLVTTLIQYSDKVFIDMKTIFDMAGNDKTSIWQHLLTLSALLNPASRAKDILKKDKETKEPEDDFLTNLVEKVGQNIDPTSSNPMDCMNSLMTSGVFGELMSSMDKGINEGSLDVQKMVGSLQNMIGSISTMMEADKLRTHTKG
jgi:hypothetical protein